MRRQSPFERDFRDLHGEAPFPLEGEPVGSSRYRVIVRPKAWGTLTQRIGLGLLGVFGIVVFGLALVAMLIAGGVFVWAALTA